MTICCFFMINEAHFHPNRVVNEQTAVVVRASENHKMKWHLFTWCNRILIKCLWVDTSQLKWIVSVYFRPYSRGPPSAPIRSDTYTSERVMILLSFAASRISRATLSPSAFNACNETSAYEYYWLLSILITRKKSNLLSRNVFCSNQFESLTKRCETFLCIYFKFRLKKSLFFTCKLVIWC